MRASSTVDQIGNSLPLPTKTRAGNSACPIWSYTHHLSLLFKSFVIC